MKVKTDFKVEGTLESQVVKITAGAGNGKVFTSDADGKGSWATATDNDTGVTSLSVIGAVPNGNGGTILGRTLNLQPASINYGGVVTTGPQSFAGVKYFTSEIKVATKIIVDASALDYASFETHTGKVGVRIDNQDGIFYYADNKLQISSSGVSKFGGPLTATSFLESSLRKLKINIQPYEKSGLDIINSLDIVTYNKKDALDIDKIGVIIDDSPIDIANEDQTAVDLYKTIFVQAKAIQELTARLEKLEKHLL